MTPSRGHLLFVDESGSHDLRNVDPKWPVFVLAGLLVAEKYYVQTLVPCIKSFKARHGLSRTAVLHSRSIRRWEGNFSFLADPARREAFYADLNALITALRIRVFAVAIDKNRLAGRYLVPVNPYNISLSLLLSLVCGSPGMPSANRPNVSRIIAESRGKVEDKQLQGEYQAFRRFGLSSYGAADVASRRARTVRKVFPDRVEFARKSKVVAGLELADLVAYPIARAVVNQRWDNPAYRVVARKLRGKIDFP